LEKVIDIIESIAYEKSLRIEDVKEAIKEAIVKVAKEYLNSGFTERIQDIYHVSIAMHIHH